ncbi:hypothetical protein GN316_15655 [Xylophilus sp. Kf1]|nr:hypothetical protein [Xylophilus sp. Kf1]
MGGIEEYSLFMLAPLPNLDTEASPMKPNSTSAASLCSVLPQVDRSACRLRRCVAAAVVTGHPWSLHRAHRPDPCVEVEAVAQVVTQGALQATVRTPFGAARLAIATAQWPALAGAATLDDDVRRNAVAGWLVRARMGSLAALVSAIELDAGPPRDVPATGVFLHSDSVRIDVLTADDGLLQAIEAALAQRVPALADAALQRRLPSRFLLASRAVSVGRLRALRVGDVVLLPSVASTESGLNARWSWGDGGPAELCAHVFLRGSSMSLKLLPALADTAEYETISDGSPPTTVELLARLELPIAVELAGPLLRLADIARLTAGDVLEMPVPIDQAQVRLTVARQALGWGELVAIGGRLGVRILRIDAMPGSNEAVSHDGIDGGNDTP